MNRCPTCGDVETVRYENIGGCLDRWHRAQVDYAAIIAQDTETLRKLHETAITRDGAPQDLSITEQFCPKCTASFFFMLALDGDCSHQKPAYCPQCGKLNVGD